ncbi:MAG: DUF1232 domain-containing protein [Parabacteroides sp.]|nr:DUF1232 domain-containing protein [Parabacteroides sp.]
MSIRSQVASSMERLKAQASEKDVSRINRRLGSMNRGSLKKVWGEVILLWGAARDKNAPWYTKAVAIAALLYVIIPFDVLPDFIPYLGLADDVVAVAMGVSYLGIALNKYKHNRKEKKSAHCK